MNKLKSRLAAACALAGLLNLMAAGCGQSGPLYLPDETTEMQPVIPAPEPGPDDENAEDDEAGG